MPRKGESWLFKKTGEIALVLDYIKDIDNSMREESLAFRVVSTGVVWVCCRTYLVENATLISVPVETW